MQDIYIYIYINFRFLLVLSKEIELGPYDAESRFGSPLSPALDFVDCWSKSHSKVYCLRKIICKHTEL